MEYRIYKYIDMLIERYPQLKSASKEIEDAYEILESCFTNGGKLLVAGKGGSAADSEHIVGELMKGFEKPRVLNNELRRSLVKVDSKMGTILAENLQMALPAIALDGHVALTTAYMNDCNPLLCFAQQINGYGNGKDVFLGISTSGNSKNIIYAAITAKAKGMKVIGLTGSKQCELQKLSDVTIHSTENRTYMIQEQHLPIYHCLCLMLEERFWGNL